MEVLLKQVPLQHCHPKHHPRRCRRGLVDWLLLMGLVGPTGAGGDDFQFGGRTLGKKDKKS